MSTQNRDYKKLHKIMYCEGPEGIYSEVTNIVRLIDAEFDFAFLDATFTDILLLFKGNYPGFQASTTRYHDLPHTCWVALALIRLVHSHILEGKVFSRRIIELGLLTAFFHDTGLILEESDHQGTGAKHTIGHEERSIELLSSYLTQKNHAGQNLVDLAPMIHCTILAKPPSEIVFESDQVKLMGYILGSADLMAQMAERTYLEKLPLLFEEFKEGGVPGFESSFDLLKKTENFYKAIVLKRLNGDMEGVGNNTRKHFLVRWGIDKDFYNEAINNQIEYLKTITQECSDSYENLLKRLRRRSELPPE